MSRKEASNTFTDGLIKDLNPINTPNTVLTDCLNGTLITYDGNEYNLQNEKGNYALKNCKLKPNYIPVGIKEYGDILYIVSYNPLTEHTEIGSYPSPETIYDPDDLSDLEQTVNSTLNNVSGSINYSEIVQNRQPLYVFYGASEYGPEEYKLNPGDLYKISSNVLDLSVYEELKYFIFDDNRRSYDITDKIEKNTLDFKHVNWDIPGWIAVQPKFAEITDFSVNVKKLIVPSYGNSNIKLTLNFQLSSEDELYLKNLSSAINDLKVEFKITASGSNISDYTTGNIVENLGRSIDTKNGSVSFYSEDWLLPSNSGVNAVNYSTLTIEATPYVIAKTGVKVYYEKFKKILTFNLNQKGSASDFNIGSGHWWYNTDSKERSFNLMFDTKGLANSSVLDEDVFLFYTLTRIDGSYVTKSDGSQYKQILCEDWNMIGETTLELPFEEFSQANFTSNPSRFYAEDFYVMTFDFYGVEQPTGQTSPLRSSISKFITASELMNGQKVALFDTVSFDTWVKRYKDSIKNRNVTIVKQGSSSPTFEDPFIENKASVETWKNNKKSSKYSSLVEYIDFEDSLKDGFSIVCNANSSISVSYGTDASLLVGPMWNALNAGSYAIFDISNNKRYFSQYTGKLPSVYSGSLTGSAQKKIKYSFSAISPEITIWDYSYKPLKFSTFSTSLTSDFIDDVTSPGWGTYCMYIDAIPSANIDKFSWEIFTSGTNPGSTLTNNVEFLGPIVSKIGVNDVLLIGLGLGEQRHSNQYSGEKLTGVSDIITRVNNSGSTEYAYFAGFKRTEESLALVRIQGTGMTEEEASGKLNTWIEKLQKLECDRSTEVTGTFYVADEGIDTTPSSMSMSMKGSITFGPLIYTSSSIQYNLLSNSERISLVSGLSDINLSNLTKLNGEGQIDFNECALEQNNEIISVTLDFSSKNSEIQSIKNEIELINTQSQSQLSDYLGDSVLNTQGIGSDTIKYVEKVNGSVGSLMLDLINSQIFDEDVALYFDTWHNNNGYTRHLAKYLGRTSGKYLIS